jgi:hypothetical protein
MRRIAGILALAALGAAAGRAVTCASGQAHIVDTVQLADGSAAAGQIYVTGPTAAGGAVVTVARSTLHVAIGSGGAVDFCLAGGVAWRYDAEYRLTVAGRAMPSYTERWFAPAAGTLTIRQLWGGTGVPQYLVSPQQINPFGLSAGQVWVWDGTSFVAASVGAGVGVVVSINIPDPESGDLVVWEMAPAIHLTRISCNTVGGTGATINLDKRTEAAPDTDTGNHLLSSDLTCTTGSFVSATAFANDSTQCGGTSTCAVASRMPVAILVTGVAGTVGLRVFLEYTVD